jgi:hypothetical protein
MSAVELTARGQLIADRGFNAYSWPAIASHFASSSLLGTPDLDSGA